MKKRMCIYFLIFIISVFYLSIPKGVFGQEQSLTTEVFNAHESTILDESIRPLLPDVLHAFKQKEVQSWLDTASIQTILNNPGFLTAVDRDIDYRFVGLLTLNDDLRKLFADEKFQTLLLPPNQIEELVRLIEEAGPIEDPDCPVQLEPEPPKATTLSVVRGYGQTGLPDTRLGEPFVVKVQDQYGDPFSEEVSVIFRVTKGDGRLLRGNGSGSREITVMPNDNGEAAVTLKLGPIAGANSVEASVGNSLMQHFTAAAIVPAELPVPERPELHKGPGDGQQGQSNTPLQEDFVVIVRDQNNRLLANIGVIFSVTMGKGSLSDKTTITGTDGKAQTRLTLGPMSGKNEVEARIAGLPSQAVTFTATARGGAIAQLPLLYWIENGSLYRFTRTGRKEQLPGVNNPISFAVNMEGGNLYWVTQTGNKGNIHRATLDGTNPGVIRSNLREIPINIAINTVNNEIYWTNEQGKIQRAIPSAKGHRIENVLRNLTSPQHIALDVDRNRVYWTENDGDMGWSIKRAILPVGETGKSNSQKPFRSNLGDLEGIAVVDDKVYWTEKTADGRREVSCANVNGLNETKVTVLDRIPLGLAFDASGLYWTAAHGRIERVNLIQTGPASPAAPSTIVEHSEQNVLLANYPNPFNPETWIPYQLSEPADVSVSIYSVNGHLIRTLALGHQAAGVYRNRSRAAYWDGRNELGERVASGLYFYTLTAGDFTATRKMLIRK